MLGYCLSVPLLSSNAMVQSLSSHSTSRSRGWSNRISFVLTALILGLQVLGIYKFTCGFFLTRLELPVYSTCDEFSTNQAGCWLSSAPRFNRLIVLVVDAWRYDFAEPATNDEALYYRGQMPHVSRLLHTAKQNNHTAELFQFIADTPTVTMQRLKGILTGGLPTFIDVSANFAASVLVEDNIIHQIHTAKCPLCNATSETVFMGDDTWIGLFPSMFTKRYAYPSFDVWDLDTVDNGVLAHLMPTVEQKNASLIIAHFLGVDHVGHRYNTPNHPEMQRKLRQMDEVVGDVASRIDNTTLLLVMGDHGMTNDGAHGGASKEETHAALLMYAKQPHLIDVEEYTRVVQQVDIVPTLSLLSGFPVPYASVGAILPLLYHSSSGDSVKQLDAYAVNGQQLWRYISSYQKLTGSFTAESMARAEVLFMAAMDATHDVRGIPRRTSLRTSQNAGDTTVSNASFSDVKALWREFYAFVSNTCRERWVQYDEHQMQLGLALVLVSLLFQLCAVTCDFNNTIYKDKRGQQATRTCGQFVKQHVRITLGTVLSLVLVAMRLDGFMSNSFIISEHQVVCFLLISGLIVLGVTTAAPPHTYVIVLSTALVAVLLRLCVKGDGLWWPRPPNISLPSNSTTTEASWTITPESSFMSTSSISLWCFFMAPVVFELVVACRNGLGNVRVFQHLSTSFLIHILCNFIVAYHWYEVTTTARQSWALILLYIVAAAHLAWLLIRQKEFIDVLHALSPVLIVLNGPYGIPAILSCCISIIVLSSVLQQGAADGGKSVFLLHRGHLSAFIWSWMADHFYFATGHGNQFNSLHFTAAFVGFDRYSPWVGVPLMLLETFGAHMLVTPAAYLSLQQLQHRGSALLTAITPSSLNCFMICVACFVMRRHLMLWAIFAPKFVFEMAAYFIRLAMLTLTASINAAKGGRKPHND